jgi:hypothetical protein
VSQHDEIGALDAQAAIRYEAHRESGFSARARVSATGNIGRDLADELRAARRMRYRRTNKACANQRELFVRGAGRSSAGHEFTQRRAAARFASSLPIVKRRHCGRS